MIYPILAAGFLVLMAFLAHTLIGIREAMSIRPNTGTDCAGEKAAALERNWVQSLCAFQLVTVDLLFLSAGLLMLGGTDWLPARREVALAAACFFALWGVAWVLQIAALRRPRRDYLLLGQWGLWLACAALVWWGSRSL